jgi:hypothetical protein
MSTRSFVGSVFRLVPVEWHERKLELYYDMSVALVAEVRDLRERAPAMRRANEALAAEVLRLREEVRLLNDERLTPT